MPPNLPTGHFGQDQHITRVRSCQAEDFAKLTAGARVRVVSTKKGRRVGQKPLKTQVLHGFPIKKSWRV